jgi:hypothetical protein
VTTRCSHFQYENKCNQPRYYCDRKAKGTRSIKYSFQQFDISADAIRAASKLKADLKFSEVEASFVDVPDMQHLSNKEDIVNAFLFSKRSRCKMSKNVLNAISCSDSFLIVE